MNFKLHLLFVFISCVTLISANETTKLLFVQILFRHGDRSPISLYPTDPNPVSVWPEGLGKLTMLGRKQHYLLGDFFRNRYKDFITSSPLEVDVRSSSVDRCMKSAGTNVASFFAPSSKWAFENDLKWQPINIRYIPKVNDKYLETDSYCPRADEEKRRIILSPEGQKYLSEHKDMLNNLTFYSGNKTTDWITASYLHDTLFIEKKYNLTIPSWVEPYWDELSHMADLSFYWSYSSPLMHRLRAGPLIQLIIETFQQKINGDIPEQKVQIYSGHDTNIAVVLNALNLFNMIQPPYCSSLLFELYENQDGEKLLKILYQNSSKVESRIEPQVLILDGCSELCPLNYFINFTKSIIPDDWDKECQLEKSFVEKMKDQQVTIGWLFIIVAIIIVSMTVYTLWKIFSRRQDKDHISSIKYSSLDS